MQRQCGLQALGLQHAGLRIEQILKDPALQWLQLFAEQCWVQLRELIEHRVLALGG